jgi:hypothetical protein
VALKFRSSRAYMPMDKIRWCQVLWLAVQFVVGSGISFRWFTDWLTAWIDAYALTLSAVCLRKLCVCCSCPAAATAAACGVYVCVRVCLHVAVSCVSLDVTMTV